MDKEAEISKIVDEIKSRTLKITEALYRTTDLFFDDEPLKWSLRETAIEVLDVASKLSKTAASHSGCLRRINQLCLGIESLLVKIELAASSSFISRINFEVLKREYSTLLRLSAEEGKSLMDTSLLDIPVLDTFVSDKRNDKEMKLKNEKNLDSNQNNSIFIETKKEPKMLLDGRRELILNSLKENGPAKISDLSRIFRDSIGLKTIQRELNSLVKEGLIQKEGEKRWRKYYYP